MGSVTPVRTLSRALVSHFGADRFASRSWRVSAASTTGFDVSSATTCGDWSPMAARASLDSQMPDALGGWVMIYLTLILGLAAALLRDGVSSVARHHDAQGSRDDGKGPPRQRVPGHATMVWSVSGSPSEAAWGTLNRALGTGGACSPWSRATSDLRRRNGPETRMNKLPDGQWLAASRRAWRRGPGRVQLIVAPGAPIS
jgi:hypothetical protein